MIRTDTLAFSRIALLATLIGTSGVALGQSLTQTSTGGWESQGTAQQHSFRRVDASTTDWRPTRSDATAEQAEQAEPSAPNRSAAKPKQWLMPTQGMGQPKAAANSAQPAKPANQSALRAPRPFVPPGDAEQLAAAPRPSAQDATPAARVTANTSAAQASQSVARQNTNQNHAPRSPQDRVSYRPRPTSKGGTQLISDNWLRPLKQVAYQAGEPEELYAPPGDESQMPMAGREMMMGPDMSSDGEWIGAPGACGDGGCGPMCGDGVGCCSTCGTNCEPDTLDLCTVGPHDDESCDTVRIRVPKFQELMILAGVHGFKGPFDRNRNTGNFGFQEGFNVGAKLPFTETGYQFGYQAVQSQLSGDANAGITDSFAQHFFTVGAFRRTRDGFQGGAVWDLLLDERQTSVAFSQIRAEFGFVDCGCHEIGVTGAVHLRNYIFEETHDNETTTSTTFQSVDQYLLYYRMHGAKGGEGRVYGGLTDDADGIVGSDFMLPLTDSWSLLPAFTYLIPRDNGGDIAAREEAWNVSISLVWNWRGHARSCHSSPYRPLFNVADNGYMIVDDRP